MMSTKRQADSRDERQVPARFRTLPHFRAHDVVAPSDLSATSPVRGQIRLAWSNPPSSTTKLTLQRCTGATCTSFTQIAALATSTTSYIDSKVSPGTTYKYRLIASDATASAPKHCRHHGSAVTPPRGW